MIIDRNAVPKDVFEKIEAICNCASKDKSRKTINYVKLHVERGQKFLVSTDGKCLGIYDVTHSKLFDFMTALRCRMYRVEKVSKSRIVLDDCTATYDSVFPNWKKLSPDLGEYSKLIALSDKFSDSNYAQLLYALAKKNYNPISLDLFSKVKAVMGETSVYTHPTDSGKPIILNWGDFRWIAKPTHFAESCRKEE